MRLPRCRRLRALLPFVYLVANLGVQGGDSWDIRRTGGDGGLVGTVMWRSRELLAWTDRDGPGRPPRGPAGVLTGSLAVSLAVAHGGMLFSDTLCPEHRAWVFGLAGAALVAAGFAVVGLLRGWATSAILTVVAALCGVAIGVIDAAHDASRGQLIAVTFGVVAVAGAFLALWHLRLHRWERRTVAALAPLVTQEQSSWAPPSSEPGVDAARAQGRPQAPAVAGQGSDGPRRGR